METVERSIWIAAPRERVWQAVTQPQQVAQWIFPPEIGAMINPAANGKLTMSMGPMEVDVVVFESMDAPRQVTSRSLPDKLIATTYTLAEENDGTRLTIAMSGFEALPEGERHDRLKISGDAWEKALANLKAFVDGIDLPFPQPPVAPLFGYWREMPDKIAVERSIWIKASRERVWDALTDPAKVQKWFSPGSTFKSKGEGVGAKLYVEDPETGGELYIQVIEEIDPPNVLVMKSQPEPPETSFTTRYRLLTENDGTRLTLTFWGYEAMPADQRAPNMEQNTFGFGMMMENIKALLEDTPLPFPMGF